MPDENGTPVDETPTPHGYRWAVVVTGFVGGDFVPVPIQDSKGRAAPQICRVCNDEQDARKHMKRLRSMAARVEMFGNSAIQVTIPIYGILETDLPAGQRRKPNPNAFGRGTTAASSKKVTAKK